MPGMSITLKYSEREVKDFLDCLVHWFGLVLTKKQLKEFLVRHPQIAAEVKWGGTDTATRDYFIERFSEELTGMTWPINADGEEYSKKFYRRFGKEAKKKGYKWIVTEDMY
jgi:hypothetical protein